MIYHSDKMRNSDGFTLIELLVVMVIIGLLAAGRTHAEILQAYSYLEADDIRAALSYAAWRTEEVELPLP